MPHDYAVVGFFFGHTRGRSGMSEEKKYLSNGSDAAPEALKGARLGSGRRCEDGRPQVHGPAWHLAARVAALSALEESAFDEGLRLRRLLDPRLEGNPGSRTCS